MEGMGEKEKKDRRMKRNEKTILKLKKEMVVT